MRTQKFACMEKETTTVFAGVGDPRVAGRCHHKLSDILLIAFCTLPSNSEDFEDMVEFANQRLDWLGALAQGLPNGVPSHDNFKHALRI